jgi:hypothetical protein
MKKEVTVLLRSFFEGKSGCKPRLGQEVMLVRFIFSRSVVITDDWEQ